VAIVASIVERSTNEDLMARIAFLLFTPWLASAGKVTPVQQVLSMLADMKTKGQKAMLVEKKIFADYTEWVDDETTKLSQEIQTGKNSISKLGGFIEKAESDVNQLHSAIAKLDGEIATMEGDKKAATTQREEEHAEYVKLAEDYQESVDALALAIQTL
jgi:chromosome segregation ATPase